MEQTIQDLIDGRFKDRSPMATVEKIRQILADHGIETEEIWHETSVPYCYAMSIKIPGTSFRVNGKGLTKEFTLASGYGELMERLQMGFINGPNVLKDGDFSIDNAKYDTLPASELLTDRHWYEKMSQCLQRFTGESMTAEQIVGQYADPSGNVSVTPFFDLTDAKKTHLPTIMRKRLYGTNGCAAGNTPEEAIVQAISEIVERNHQLHIIEEGLTLPDIPEEELQKYEAAYAIISFVRSNGYKVCMKDASLGTGYPVVCACIIDERTGRYHTHFGAYPIFEIALERSLTESFQGRNIQNIATFEDFSERKTGEFSLSHISNELTIGTWIKRPEFFVGTPHRGFDPGVGFSGGNNRQLLRQCIDYFSAQGYHILVRDRSCLGFPTYQVVIPGYSEAHINRLSLQMDDHRYAPHAIKTLRSPSTANIPDMLGLLMHLDQMKRFTSNVRGVHGFLTSAKLSADLSRKQEDRLMSASLAYVYYELGRYDQVLQCIPTLLQDADDAKAGYLICLKRYLSLITGGYSKEEATEILHFFHRQELADQFLTHSKNPFRDMVLHCDMDCKSDCPIFEHCYQKRVMELSELLDRRMEQMDFEAFADALRAAMV